MLRSYGERGMPMAVSTCETGPSERVLILRKETSWLVILYSQFFLADCKCSHDTVYL
jgi:hypothetical protein